MTSLDAQPEPERPGPGTRPEISFLSEYRNRLRAERLDRLRRAAPPAATADAEALEAFLGALKDALRSPRPARTGAPAVILRFSRPGNAA
jgi:hypothetical protein